MKRRYAMTGCGGTYQVYDREAKLEVCVVSSYPEEQQTAFERARFVTRCLNMGEQAITRDRGAYDRLCIALEIMDDRQVEQFKKETGDE